MTDCWTVIAIAMQVEASAIPCTNHYSRNGHTKHGIDGDRSNHQHFGKSNGCTNYKA